jgi:uncharacterized protein YutE (UPF0331/DUF86 family)
MNERLKAGADIHAGGGYEEGTQEGYEAFLKVRNMSLAERRIKELAEQATTIEVISGRGFDETQYTERFSKEKFAELIIRECIDTLERHHPYTKDPETYLYAISIIEEHFGVDK